MRHNEERRTQLVDAAIELLAAVGARGLTYRALDAKAGVPAGTSSNYFRTRDDLLQQVGLQIYRRLQPAPQYLEETRQASPTRELEIAVLKELVQRVMAERTGQLALLELRLEATRRPELEAALTETIAGNINENVDYHLSSHLPGEEIDVKMMYLAISGLLVERLTLPGVIDEAESDRLVETLVDRLFFR